VFCDGEDLLAWTTIECWLLYVGIKKHEVSLSEEEYNWTSSNESRILSWLSATSLGNYLSNWQYLWLPWLHKNTSQ